MALAVQIVEQGSSEPSGELFFLGWLEAQLCVDAPLLPAGVTGVLVAGRNPHTAGSCAAVGKP